MTLQNIYEAMDVDSDFSQSAIELELRLERQLAAPVRRNLDQTKTEDIIVSDTYLPPSELETTLACFTSSPPATIWTSSAEGVRKAEGLLWDRVVAQHTNGLSHVGDNRVSDVVQPTRRGISSELFSDCLLNPGERFLSHYSLDGSILAGCSRATRVSRRETDDPSLSPLLEMITSVFAPILVAFIDWVFQRAAHFGAERILFMARDGQLLHHAAQTLALQRGATFRLEYIYGSRQALHLPGFDGIDLAKDWLLENTPFLSLSDLADRSGLDPKLVSEIAREYGYHSFDGNIPSARRTDLDGVIRDPRFVRAISLESEKRWRAAYDYYRKVGIGQSPALIVDVGWSGRMQASLRQIIEKGLDGDVVLHGTYLSLSRKFSESPSNTLEGFLHDPKIDGNSNPLDPYRSVIEAMLQADHGTTVSFQYSDVGIEPLLAKSPDGLTVRAVQFQRSVVKNFADSVLQVESAIGRRIHVDRSHLKRNLIRMLSNPTYAEASAFLNRSHAEGQIERSHNHLVRKVEHCRELRRREGWGLWPEGTLAISGLSGLNPIVGTARQLKQWQQL